MPEWRLGVCKERSCKRKAAASPHIYCSRMISANNLPVNSAPSGALCLWSSSKSLSGNLEPAFVIPYRVGCMHLYGSTGSGGAEVLGSWRQPAEFQSLSLVASQPRFAPAIRSHSEADTSSLDRLHDGYPVAFDGALRSTWRGTREFFIRLQDRMPTMNRQ